MAGANAENAGGTGTGSLLGGLMVGIPRTLGGTSSFSISFIRRLTDHDT